MLLRIPFIAVIIAAFGTRETLANDFAEANAADWSTFASDGAPASVANDATRVRAGQSSILFTTGSGFDTGVRYPAASNWNFDASAFNTLVFWEYPDNNTPIGWQGNQPIVVIRTGTGTIRLEPTGQLSPNHMWRLFKVPLNGGGGWTRTVTGSPNLVDVDQIEIHHDTWDYGFSINFDGVQFMYLDPDALPPPGPPPPPGVDPDAVRPRVLLYIYNPIMNNFGGVRMNEAYGWRDPVALAQQVAADFALSSHGRALYEIVETVDDPTFPYLENGFQYTDVTFHQAWTSGQLEPGTFDYVRFATDHNLATRVDAGEIDEVWLYAFPGAGCWEAAMAGAGAYWVNGGAYPAAGGERAYVIMGWNYERGVGEAIHSFGHRCESTLADKVYGQWCQSRCNTWSRFALLDINQPGLGGVGNVHYPVNATSDYDYANPRFVLSNADAWLSYPDLNDATRLINFHEWSPADQDPQREYLNWWYAHMPHAPSRAPDYYLANWWRYLCDVDQFKSGNASMFLTIGIPEVQLTAPPPGSTVSGVVAVRADAWVDGALGRVDFYVDDVYTATDTLSPYRFEWNTAGASPGEHQLVARAYELQNGTEAVSTPVSVMIATPCPADIDASGHVDLADLAILLSHFGETNATGPSDVNSDGRVDLADLAILLSNFGTNCP
jgi:hypothetical protein